MFTDTEVKLSGPAGGGAYRYQLDPTSMPKRCDLQVLPLELDFTVHAIYRFDGDELTLAVPTSESAKKPVHLTTLDPGPDRDIYVFKRLQNPSGDAAADAEALPEQEAAALIGLRQALNDAAGILETGNMQEFAMRFVVPLHPETAAQVAQQLANPDNENVERAQRIAKLLRI
ncbi:MAG TPA: hypothetical protein VHY20_13375, partial [Pirellulales bacterium]|nr:hypothetical protein [Pirellulales bacterium]